jgi:hypothetical protein
MRTTIDIREDLLARAKEAAAAQHCRLSDLVNDALLAVLESSHAASVRTEPFHIQPFDLGPALPGIDLSDNAGILEAMDDDARAALTRRRDPAKLL